jgi:hypothetical protein
MLRGTKSSRLYSNSVIVFRDYISHIIRRVFPDNLFAPLFLVCAMDGSHNKLGRLVGSGIFLLLGTSKVVIASYIIYETRLLSSKHPPCKKGSHKRTGRLILTTGTCRSGGIGYCWLGTFGNLLFFHGIRTAL